MPVAPEPDRDPASPEWTPNDPPTGKSPSADRPDRQRVRRKIRRPGREGEPQWERRERATRHSGRPSRSGLPSYLLTGVICFSLGMLTTWFLQHPPLQVDPPAPEKRPDPITINRGPTVPASEILDRREQAIETHRKAVPIIETFLDPVTPDNLAAILRPTPGVAYNLSRYSAERTRLASIDREVATRITSKEAFTGFPIQFANGETRTAWFEHVGDDRLLLDLDSFLGCGDLTLKELEQTAPVEPVRVRGFGRILAKKRGSPDDAPEILALRDASRQTILLLQIDAQSTVSDAVMEKLRETPRQLPILLDAARSPTPTNRSRLRVVKVHALHWLYVPGFQLTPEPDDAPNDTP